MRFSNFKLPNIGKAKFASNGYCFLVKEDVQMKYRASVLIGEYVRVLLWCVTCNLLPERQGLLFICN